MSVQSKHASSLTLPYLDSSSICPRSIPNYTISREVLEHMSTLHKLVAEHLIKTGQWRLID